LFCREIKFNGASSDSCFFVDQRWIKIGGIRDSLSESDLVIFEQFMIVIRDSLSVSDLVLFEQFMIVTMAMIEKITNALFLRPDPF